MSNKLIAAFKSRCLDPFTQRNGRGQRQQLSNTDSKKPMSQSSEYPNFPPPPPREILQNSDAFRREVLSRQYGAPRGVLEDRPIYALYRIYEHILIDDNIGMRNELESFWFKRWPVCDIPDPRDEQVPERYAVLACIPSLLVEAFNQRIDLGLRREGQAIMNQDERDRLAESLPKDQACEREPTWTSRVKPLEVTLSIPHTMEGQPQLTSLDDERASPPFKAKNIMLWHPHIHFV